MSMAVLLTLTGGTLQGAEAARKSFPEFFSYLRQLGISVEEDA
jgi:3-phosphoshikimate 1-carboxyvinyltransferase